MKEDCKHELCPDCDYECFFCCHQTEHTIMVKENKRQRLADLDEFYNLFTLSVTWGEIKDWIAQKRKGIENGL